MTLIGTHLMDPQSLPSALNRLKVDDLRSMMARLPGGVRGEPRLKPEVVAAISDYLLGNSVQRLWRALDVGQQHAVRESVHSSDGCLNLQLFMAKYEPEHWYEVVHGHGHIAAPLSLIIHHHHYASDNSYTIPGELRKHLRSFVPPPIEASLDISAGIPDDCDDEGQASFVPLQQRCMERAALLELFALLSLVDTGQVAVSAKTSRATAVTVQRVGEVLFEGDFFEHITEKGRWDPEIGPVRAIAWPWLLQASKLVRRRDSKLELTKAGRTARGAPPAEALRQIWNGWLNNKLLDEFSRIEVIKGQRRKGRGGMTEPSSRRAAIASALQECPVGQWVGVREFSRYMRARDHDFEVTNDPWRLYIADSHYGSLGYSGMHDWKILQDRYMLCFLFEYAATLGMVDVAFTRPQSARPDYADIWGTDELSFLSRYDGLEYFRLTPLGAYCLGLADSYEAPVLRATSTLSVLPSLHIQQSGAPLAPEEASLLEIYATPVSEGVWVLELGKVVSALEAGHEVETLRVFLAERDEQPLPERVEGFLRDSAYRAGALNSRDKAILIECVSAEIAELLATDARSGKFCQRVGTHGLVVRAVSESGFRKAVRSLGYGMPLT